MEFLWTLLRLSLLGSVLGLILMGLLRLLGRQMSRAVGYYLWLIVLLRLCVPVWVDLPIPAYEDSAADTAVMSGQHGIALPARSPADQGGQAPDSGQPAQPSDRPAAMADAVRTVNWRSALHAPALWFTVWALGFIFSLSRYGWSYLRFVRLVRRRSRAPGQVALEVLKELDCRGKTALAVCPAVPGPMALGLLRPTVLLPEEVEDRGRLEDILRHEIAHLRRHDLAYKWLTAVVTSLHWFNPLMPLFRREIARRCELACDEAAAASLTPAERRRYGETLLALAAAAPGGAVVTTLCEDKKHLKERLMSLVDPVKPGPAAIALTLCVTLLLGGCSLVGGTAVQGPAADRDALLTGAALYELGDGITLAIPADITEELLVERTDGTEGEFQGLRVYHRASYEAGMEDLGSPMGLLFSLFRYDQVGYEQNFLATNGGVAQSVFARDGEWYYGMSKPTDVQFYTVGGDVDIDGTAFQRWEYICSRISDIQADFIARNSLTAYDGAADLERPFLWEGEHRYVACHNADYSISLTLLLAQPAKQGNGGIWCVEGSIQNGNGGWNKELPVGIAVTAAEYYAALQAQVDEGHRPGLLDPVQTAQEWFQEEYGADTLSGMTFTLTEGVPAGDLLGTIRRVTNQKDGILESLLFPDDGSGDSESRQSFPAPEFLAGEVNRYLYTFVWVQAQVPDVIEGEAVRYRAESGDEILFLKEGGLLRITIGDTVSWFQPAYPYTVSPYDKMSGYCTDLAEESFTKE